LSQSAYKRVLLKLSGQALMGASTDIVDPEALNRIALEATSVHDLNIQLVIVIGGGNIMRGNVAAKWRLPRPEADDIGMLGTAINGVLLRRALRTVSKAEVRLMSSMPLDSIAEPFLRDRALGYLAHGEIVLLVGGLGEAFLTTDYPSVHRAIELECDAVLAAKNGIDGVFDKDPSHHPDARMYGRLSLNDAVRDELAFMDLSALILARDFRMPLHVFNFDRKGSMSRICRGEALGTYVANDIENKFTT
jgi:uridylate kinase